ncbi:MAG: hypothetical protein WCO56_10400 [Verrucomicrobiota bacterium]
MNLALNPFVPGQLVGAGRFKLVKQIGQGGMGVVWLAEDEQLQEAVALKFVSPLMQNDPEALAGLRRETIRARRLTHPRIVRIHDFHHLPGEGLAFLSMEYVAGQSLEQERRKQPDGCFPWPVLAPWVGQLLRGASWRTDDPAYLLASYRASDTSRARSSYGFRIVLGG